MVGEQNDDKVERKEGDRGKANITYLEIFRNLEEGRVRHNCYLDDILECEIKCVTT
jgi:hypothetical protein